MNTSLRCSGVARVLKWFHSLTCTPCFHPLMEWTIRFSFPAKTGPHLPTPEGWKAELAWVLVTYRNTYPAPGIAPVNVTHLSTNQAQRRLTSLIEANTLLLRLPPLVFRCVSCLSYFITVFCHCCINRCLTKSRQLQAARPDLKN